MRTPSPDGVDPDLGMAVALYKTLVGSVLNVWLMVNCPPARSWRGEAGHRNHRRGEAHVGFDRFEDDAAGIVFRDLITLALCGFVVWCHVDLPHSTRRSRKPPRTTTRPAT